MTPTRTAEIPLSKRIREDTREVHEHAEHAPFIQDLLGGRLGLEGYARLVVQHQAIYTELEAAVAANSDPVVGEFLAAELSRLAALRADLDYLREAGVATASPVLAATQRYCEHIRTVCFQRPAALLAHHYVRYLGDLSGGMIVARVLRRHLELPDERGTSFYAFPELASPREFKLRYRALLDALPWGEAERDALIAEVHLAYQFNAEILYSLGADPVVPAPSRR
ncbi:MAG: biliverdin-producing heme oxygenase [Sporichthyaceae bacterium]